MIKKNRIISISVISLLGILLVAIFLLIRIAHNNKTEISIEYWKNEFGEKGNIREKCTFRNGQLDGYCYQFYSNSQLMSKTIYKKNRLIKIVCVFDPSGKKLNFGQLDETGTGYVITYSDISGTREYSGYYKNGRREGWWKNYTYPNEPTDSIFYTNSHPDFMPSLDMTMY